VGLADWDTSVSHGGFPFADRRGPAAFFGGRSGTAAISAGCLSWTTKSVEVSRGPKTLGAASTRRMKNSLPGLRAKVRPLRGHILDVCAARLWMICPSFFFFPPTDFHPPLHAGVFPAPTRNCHGCVATTSTEGVSLGPFCPWSHYSSRRRSSIHRWIACSPLRTRHGVALDRVFPAVPFRVQYCNVQVSKQRLCFTVCRPAESKGVGLQQAARTGGALFLGGAFVGGS